jgi:hypothetical protein
MKIVLCLPAILFWGMGKVYPDNSICPELSGLFYDNSRQDGQTMTRYDFINRL